MNKPSMVYIYMKEYYSAIKKEILSFVTTWMALEGIIVTEVKQRKTKYSIISLICEILKHTYPQTHIQRTD